MDHCEMSWLHERLNKQPADGLQPPPVVEIYDLPEGTLLATTNTFNLTLLQLIDALTRAPSVEDLFIIETKINEYEALLLGDLIQNSTSILTFQLNNCTYDTDFVLGFILDAIAKNTSITVFDFFHTGKPLDVPMYRLMATVLIERQAMIGFAFIDNTVDSIKVAEMCEGIKNHTGLKRVSFGGNTFNDDCVKIALYAVNYRTSIEEVTLLYTFITERGAIEIADFTRSAMSVTSLHLIDIEFEFHRDKITATTGFVNYNDDGVQIGQPTHVNTLEMSNINIGNDGAALIARNVAKSGGLHRLALIDMGMGIVGIAAIARAGTNLTDLSVEGNHFNIPILKRSEENSMVNELSNLLSTKLESLNIARCGVFDETLAQLVPAIGASTTLIGLDVSDNEFGINGIRSIVELIKMNTPLRKINLRHQTIPESLVEPLIQAVERNTHLIDLTMGVNAIPDRERIDVVLSRNADR